MIEELTVKEQKTHWSKTYSIDTSTTTQLAFKQLISSDTNVPVNDIRVLCGGKFLKDDQLTLQETGVKPTTKILLLRKPSVSSPSDDNVTASTSSAMEDDIKKTAFYEQEQKAKRMQRIRETAEYLAKREGGGTGSYEQYHMVIENQNGERIRLPKDQTQRLTLGMCMQKIGQTFLMRGEYRDAYDCFEMADEEWRLVDADLMSSVDNYAQLNVEMVYTMYQLKDASLLAKARSRLAIAEKILERAHGKNMQRLQQISKGTVHSRELILYARLHLLQAVVEFYEKDYSACQQLLWKTEFELNNLHIDPNLIESLTGMGFNAHESKLALRATNKNVERAIMYLLEQKELKEKKKEEERKRREQRREQLKLGTTDNGQQLIDINLVDRICSIGIYDRDLVIEGLRKTNNHEQNTLFLLTNQPDLLEANAERAIWKRYSDFEKVSELLGMGFADIQHVHFALKKTRNNLEQAINLLVEGRVNPTITQDGLYDPRVAPVVDEDLYGDEPSEPTQQAQQELNNDNMQDEEEQEEEEENDQEEDTADSNRLDELLDQRKTQQQQEEEMENLIYQEIVSNIDRDDYDKYDDVTAEMDILRLFISKFKK